MEPLHCREEIEVLGLLKELQGILAKALNSLANRKPQSAEARYVSDAATSVNIASDAYILLRDSGRVHASKLMVRPMIDVVITATAVTKEKGFLFRKAYTEFNDMVRLCDKTPENEARAKASLEKLKKRFQEEPGYPIKCKPVDGRYTAQVAGLLPVYNIAYRIYCEFTHSAVRAVRGNLDQMTDPIDTTTVIWAVRTVLNQLKAATPAEIPDLAHFDERLAGGQKAILKAWGHKVPDRGTCCYFREHGGQSERTAWLKKWSNWSLDCRLGVSSVSLHR